MQVTDIVDAGHNGTVGFDIDAIDGAHLLTDTCRVCGWKPEEAREECAGDRGRREERYLLLRMHDGELLKGCFKRDGIIRREFTADHRRHEMLREQRAQQRAVGGIYCRER